MKNKVALLASYLIVAIIAAAIGMGVSLMYLAKPFQKWQVEFSETYLPIQAEALKQLREGNPDKATRYLEMASTFSLIAMGEQRDEGARAATAHQTVEAIQYLCGQPPTTASRNTSSRLTFAESCALLLKQ